MSPREDLLPLAWRMAAGAALALAVVLVAGLFSVRISWPVPVALGLIAGTAWWILNQEAERDDAPHHPDLDRLPTFNLKCSGWSCSKSC